MTGPGFPERCDVAVVGGGNAGLCAALCAAEAGANVIVLERAPRSFRGGNSRHTRNLRCAHEAPTDFMTGTYSEAEYVGDLFAAAGVRADEALARRLVRGTAACPAWMQRFGARFQRSLRGALQLDRTNAFFLGGGKAILNGYYSAAERLGVRIAYDAEMVGFEIAGGLMRSLAVRNRGETRSIRATAVVLAAGGFEANLDWLAEIWGDAARHFVVRGTPYNDGAVLKLMLECGAQSVGHATACHTVAVDARAPRFDGGIVTRLDCVPFGIVVNKHGDRFFDEGEDVWPKRYAVWGGLVARQPDQVAYAIVDAKAAGAFIPSLYPPIAAESVGELARKLDVPPERLENTIAGFNHATVSGSFDPGALDDCRTEGLTPGKSHWARPIDTPPFWGFPMRPGITFTYQGLKVDARARVMMRSGSPAPNVFAAGEIMAGNILWKGYVAGAGMAIGTVFGRLAGKEAAEYARP